MTNLSGGLYLHIPYCRKKCLYCDFFSGGSATADWPLLRRCLINELKERIREVPGQIVSIYLGGGTPSLMPVPEITSLMDEIHSLIGHRTVQNPEITIEVNPEDVNEESVSGWKKMGINRVSIGVESFNDSLLKSVGRRHSGRDAVEAFKILKNSFSNISADLIFGLPGQTEKTLSEDLQTLISLRPEHLSVYSLMYEPGTAITALRDSGRVTPVDEEMSLRMFHDISRILKETGYERYEISNYAIPGFESVHNSLYWKGAPYLGLGPSAHSYDGGSIRRANPCDLKRYFKRFSETSASDSDETLSEPDSFTKPFYTEEILNDTELKEEYLLTRLRLREGFDLTDFKRRFGDEMMNSIMKKGRELADRGVVTIHNGRVALSESGIMLEDQILLDLSY